MVQGLKRPDFKDIVNKKTTEKLHQSTMKTFAAALLFASAQASNRYGYGNQYNSYVKPVYSYKTVPVTKYKDVPVTSYDYEYETQYRKVPKTVYDTVEKTYYEDVERTAYE